MRILVIDSRDAPFPDEVMMVESSWELMGRVAHCDMCMLYTTVQSRPHDAEIIVYDLKNDGEDLWTQ